MLSWAGHGGAKKIVMRKRDLAEKTLTLLLSASPNLEHLEYTQPDEDLLLPSDKQLWKRLRYVAIDGSQKAFQNAAPDVPGGFPRAFLQNAASSLEHLDFEGIPSQWRNTDLESSIPFLPKLKTLRMKDWSKESPPLPLFNLSDAFPALEQLSIRQKELNLDPGPMPTPRQKWEDIWPNLKVILYEAKYSYRGRWGEEEEPLVERSWLVLSCLTRLKRGNSLQHIRLDLGHPAWPCMFDTLYTNFCPYKKTEISQFQSLRSFRSCELYISPDGTRTLLSHGIETEQLTSFDIVFPWNSDMRYEAEVHIALCVEQLKSYDWLRGAPSIHTLGCHLFEFPHDAKNDEHLHLPQFLATFPNLRTLSIRPMEDIDTFTHTLTAIMTATHLETIYMGKYESSIGENLDSLITEAEKYGVQLKIEHRPQQWPMPLSA
ncbi:hypothetical protein E4U11_004689 [Claviceps purpurea]|nr:hypothetical protein E4U11_004689 [Claviceps purpurea]